MTTFNLRVPEDMAEQAKSAAAEENTPVNELLLDFIAEGLEQWRGLKMMKERAARGDPAAALRILDRAPDVSPEEGDEVPEADVAPGRS